MRSRYRSALLAGLSLGLANCTSARPPLSDPAPVYCTASDPASLIPEFNDDGKVRRLPIPAFDPRGHIVRDEAGQPIIAEWRPVYQR